MLPEAVVGVVRREDGRIAIIQRAPSVSAGGYWTPPSGRIEPGESQAAAVIREMREELGLEVRPVRRVWECLTDDRRYRLHWWLAEHVGGELLPEPAEVSEVRWMTPEEFVMLRPTFADDRYFFEKVFPTLPCDAQAEA